MTNRFRFLGSFVLLTILLSLGSCSRNKETSSKENGQKKAHVAFVTNQIASFWNIAKVGAQDAAKDFDVTVDVKMPVQATAVEQKRIIEDLLAGGVQAIAISPIDAENQKDEINKWAAQVPLITHDSDAPGTERLMYIGMDNYQAGRDCGKLIKLALPDGGNVILAIGRLEQDNAKRRRQGVIDELLDRSPDASRFDAVDAKIEGDKYTILATLTDQGDPDVAKRKAADAITTYQETNAMVGLFAYNPPAILQALKQADRLEKIKVIGFDEDDETLQGIKDGTVVGTIVQNPYEYGYQSVQTLAEILKGNKPADTFVDIKARTITKDNVDKFWEDLKAKMGG